MGILPGLAPEVSLGSLPFEVVAFDACLAVPLSSAGRGPGRGRGAAKVAPLAPLEQSAALRAVRSSDKRGYESLEELLGATGPIERSGQEPKTAERIAWDEHGRRCVEGTASNQNVATLVPPTPSSSIGGSRLGSASPHSVRGPLRSRGSVATGFKPASSDKRHAFIDGLSKQEIVLSPLYAAVDSLGGLNISLTSSGRSPTVSGSLSSSRPQLAGTHGGDRMLSAVGAFGSSGEETLSPRDCAPSRGPARSAWTTSLDELKRDDIALYRELNAAKARMGWNIALDSARNAAVDASEERTLAVLNDSIGLGGFAPEGDMSAQVRSAEFGTAPMGGPRGERPTSPSQPGVYYGKGRGLGAAGNGSLAVRVPRGMPDMVHYVAEDRPPCTAHAGSSQPLLQEFEKHIFRGSSRANQGQAAPADDVDTVQGTFGAYSSATRSVCVGARPSCVYQRNKRRKNDLSMSKWQKWDPEIAKELTQERDVEGVTDARDEARLAEERAEDKRKYTVWRAKVVECTRNLQLEVDRFRH